MPSYTTASPRNGLLEVGISMVLRDNFSRPAYMMQEQVRRLNQQAKMANTANLEAAYSIGDSISARAAGFMQSVWDTVKVGAEYIDTMTTVGAITNATAGELEMLSDRAQSLGLDTMFSSMDIASGMKYLAMAGNGVKEINDMIEGATYVAGATGMALGGKGGAADMITNVMKAFRKEGKDAADVIGDQLTMATLSSNISMQDLAESIKYASADLVSLKRELPEVAAMVGTLGNAGIQGSMAGVALSNMARYLNKALTNQNSSQYKALQELGISLQDVTDSNGDLISFAHVLELIRDATADMTSMQVNDVLNRIFGVRGFRAANALMHDLEGLMELEEKIATQSQGYAKSISEKRMATLAGSIEILQGAWENLKTSFTEALSWLSAPIRWLGSILDLVRKILDVPVLGNLIAISTVVGGLFTLVTGKLIKGVARFRIFQNDAMISGRNMLNVLFGGWKNVTLGAQGYAQVLARIKAMQMMMGVTFDQYKGNASVKGMTRFSTGLAAILTGAAAGGKGKGAKGDALKAAQLEALMTAGLFGGAIDKRNKLKFHLNKNGELTSIGFQRRDAKGRILSEKRIFDERGYVGSAATSRAMQSTIFASTFGAGALFNPAGGKDHGFVNPRVWARYARMKGMGTWGGVGKAAGGLAMGLGRGLLTMGRGLMGLMGGPVGVALLGLSFLPGIIESIGNNIRENRKLKAELEKNTYSVNTLAGQYAKESERRRANKNLNLEQELMLLRNSIIYWAKVLDEKELSANLYMDGRIIAKSVDKIQSKDRQNTGTK